MQQMLESLLGVQGARYAAFALAAVLLLVLVLIVWWLIRKALGDRLNMSERADRRGRPPRLGITESFTVDRQGRRLVMVRRDNVEHLIMIGGPNDVVIETSVIRGERAVVSRTEPRGPEPEIIPALVPADIMPTQPAPQPMAAQPAAPMTPAVQKPSVAPPARPIEAPMGPLPITPQAAASPAPPVVDLPRPPLAERAPDEAKAPVPEAPSRPALSLAERIKAGLPIGMAAKDGPKASPPPVSPPPIPPEPIRVETPPVDAPKVEIAKVETAKPAPVVPELPTAVAKPAFLDQLKAKLDDVLPAPKDTQPSPSIPQQQVVPPAPAAATPPAPPAPPPPAPSPAPAVAPAVAPAAVVPPLASPAVAKPASKNPFDSLEEEMAKLLGRAPDGKG